MNYELTRIRTRHNALCELVFLRWSASHHYVILSVRQQYRACKSAASKTSIDEVCDIAPFYRLHEENHMCLRSIGWLCARSHWRDIDATLAGVNTRNSQCI